MSRVVGEVRRMMETFVPGGGAGVVAVSGGALTSASADTDSSVPSNRMAGACAMAGAAAINAVNKAAARMRI